MGEVVTRKARVQQSRCGDSVEVNRRGRPPGRYADTKFSEALALEPLDMEPLNIEKAPVCPLGPSLGTLVLGPAYVPARWPRLGVLLVGPAYVRKY